MCIATVNPGGTLRGDRERIPTHLCRCGMRLAHQHHFTVRCTTEEAGRTEVFVVIHCCLIDDFMHQCLLATETRTIFSMTVTSN